jgi:ATP-dependent protease ClpP protease subunit
MIINLTGPVDDSMVNVLINGLNNKEDSIHYIYLKTEGGDVTCQDAIIHLLSENSERCVLIGYGYLYSAGFNIFYKSECPKALLPDTLGMAHFAASFLRITETGKPNMSDPDAFYLKNLKITKSTTMKFFKSLAFTEQELTEVSNGNEVWFNTKRMNELFKKHGTEIK